MRLKGKACKSAISNNEVPKQLKALVMSRYMDYSIGDFNLAGRTVARTPEL